MKEGRVSNSDENGAGTSAGTAGTHDRLPAFGLSKPITARQCEDESGSDCD